MHHASLIEEQIESCQKLLQVFQDERESLGDSQGVDMELVMKMLKRKQDILSSFEQQKKLMSSIRESGYQDEELEKKLLRELGKILEQLLVIDQENEVMIREIVGGKHKKATQPQAAATAASRPSLPFCPGDKAQASQPTAAETENKDCNTASAMNKINHFSRNRLKAYGA